MKKIKDIILSIFAVIGFVALLSSFTNNEESVVDEIGKYQLSCVTLGGGSVGEFNIETYISCARINTINGEVREVNVGRY